MNTQPYIDEEEELDMAFDNHSIDMSHGTWLRMRRSTQVAPESMSLKLLQGHLSLAELTCQESPEL